MRELDYVLQTRVRPRQSGLALSRPIRAFFAARKNESGYGHGVDTNSDINLL
jgi:hypothetical protein